MLRATLIIAATLCLPFGAAAQPYPTKPITLVVPYAPGGTNDIIARSVAVRMTSSMGKPVVVENRSGAGGNVGSHFVAKAAPDGYTLLTAPIGILAINKWLYANLGYDPEKVHDIKELISYAKANPKSVTFASMGTGTTGHLNGEMLKMLAGVDIQHIPYRGSAPALQDLLGGHVNIMFDNLPTALPLAKSGRLKAFAVTSTTRSDSLPEVPTLSEAGVSGFDATAWFGFVAPAATPAAILDKLNGEIVKALNDPDTSEKLKAQGVTIVANSRSEFADVIERESKRWKEVVEKSGAKVE
jgi:tripartite-type tricarboxylate transporter receptor subunit TctC